NSNSNAEFKQGKCPSPHFSQAFYCGGGSGHVYFVALRRAPRRTVEYVCGALGRAPCIHARLRRLATKPCEKCGLRRKLHSVSKRNWLVSMEVNEIQSAAARPA